MPSGKTGLNVPIKFVFISLAVGCLGFFIASASCGLGMSFFCGVVVFWVALSIFSMVHGTAKGIKDGYLQGDAEDSDDAKQIYTPNPESVSYTHLAVYKRQLPVLCKKVYS